MAAILTLLHTSFGAAGEKSRANRFGAMGKSCLLSVVTTNFLLPLALMPWRCISLAHAFLAHSNALREQLFPHLWPAVFLLDLRADGLDVNQQGFIADALVVAPGRLGLSASLRRQCSK